MANMVAVSLLVIALSSVALAMQMTQITDEMLAQGYDNLCPTDKKYYNVPDRDPCNLKQYVMCFKGRPVILMACPESTPYFDQNSQQCHPSLDVDLPASCNGHEVDNMPQTCADGANKLANQTSCRWYIQCDNGLEVAMQCQSGHFFIDYECTAYTLHYGESIDPSKLQHCKDLDVANHFP